MSKSSAAYDPQRSNVSAEKLGDFVRAPITGDLTEVPGIGPAAKAALAAEGITTTFGLIGKYLMLKEENVECIEHCDRFWLWLQSIGINSCRSGIVQAIAEKMDIFFPGIYDGTHFSQNS